MGCSVLLRARGSDSPDPGQLPGQPPVVGGDHKGEGVVLEEDPQLEEIVARVAALANLVSSRANSGNFVRVKESRAFIGRHALASKHAIQDRLNVSRYGH